MFDPWFSANGTFAINVTSNTFILSDSWVSMMACAEQYVFCNPSTLSCTSPAGLFGLPMLEAVEPTNSLGLNEAQTATAGRVLVALGSSNIYETIVNLGPGGLWANNLLMGISPGLPDNQWKTEVLGWFQTKLAMIQAQIVNYASATASLGPFGSVPPQNGQRVVPRSDQPEGQAYLDQCANQLVQAVGEVQNFSVCGVLVIVCGSAAIMILDCCLERIVNSFSRRDSASTRARQADSKQHLLRMALTGATDKASGWEPGSWDIPVRDGAELVDESTISDGFASYPRFKESEDRHSSTDEQMAK